MLIILSRIIRKSYDDAGRLTKNTKDFILPTEIRLADILNNSN